jgi:hypothetical protein
MERMYSINFESLSEDIEEFLLTSLVAITIIWSFFSLFLKDIR